MSAAGVLRATHGLQGLAAAAATREAAKRKGHSAEDKAQPKKARRVPIISHEVAIPKGYVAKDLSEELHGRLGGSRSEGGCHCFLVKAGHTACQQSSSIYYLHIVARAMRTSSLLLNSTLAMSGLTGFT